MSSRSACPHGVTLHSKYPLRRGRFSHLWVRIFAPSPDKLHNPNTFNYIFTYSKQSSRKKKKQEKAVTSNNRWNPRSRAWHHPNLFNCWATSFVFMGFLGLAATCVLLVPRESFKFRSSWRGSASVAFARLLVFPGFIVLSKEWAKDENISLKTPKKEG